MLGLAQVSDRRRVLLGPIAGGYVANCQESSDGNGVGAAGVFGRSVLAGVSEGRNGMRFLNTVLLLNPVLLLTLTVAAKLDGARVELVCERVNAPVTVRYGWANDPDPNRVGVVDGQPVTPFRRDRWPTDHGKEEEVAASRTPNFTGFESAQAGPLTQAKFAGATWSAPVGQAAIDSKLPNTGRHCLHLLGGAHSEVTFELSGAIAEKPLDTLKFAAERWTRRAPFRFRVSAAAADGEWREIYNGDESVKVGRAYLNQLVIPVPDGARRFRLMCSSPPNAGILIDDMSFDEAKPMEIVRVSIPEQTIPVLIGQRQSPLIQVEIETSGSRSPLRLRSASFVVAEGAEVIESLQFCGEGRKGGAAEITFDVEATLKPGINRFLLSGELGPKAGLDGFVKATCTRVLIGDRVVDVDADGSSRRKIGVALRQRRQDGVDTYRIPGITTTKAGTLIAVYDHRYRDGGDLPGDIDVGMSRSTDGGRSWSPTQVILDMGNDPRWSYDGVGDPSILTDAVTGTIWVAATWSHGNRSWHGSGPGMEPEETGQFMLVNSTDDGVTWSQPINITSQVKTDPEWRFVLQGPGNGITLEDGTLVFPAQFRGEDAEPVNGKPFSTLISSQDRGKTWVIGTGVKVDTTEAQVVQLGDGSIMINCRDNRGGSRSVYTSRDLGQTWDEHRSSRKALPEPVCNAGLIRLRHPEYGPLLLFSNPNTTQGRHHFTLKVSKDEGMTWPEKWHTLYDERPGSGYSVLTRIDQNHVGVLWEGPGELYFLRFSLRELVFPE